MDAEEILSSAPESPGELRRLQFVEGETTQICGEILEAFKNDCRVTFLVRRGTAEHVLNRIRTRISLVRKNLRAKRMPRFHYRMQSYVFGYTNSAGVKCDCIVLHKIVTKKHILTELVEGKLYATNDSRNASGAESQSSRTISW